MAGRPRHPLIGSVVELQEAEGITGSEVARRLEVNPSTWTRLVHGDVQPTVRIIQRIARAFPTLQLQCVTLLLNGNDETAEEQDHERVAV